MDSLHDTRERRRGFRRLLLLLVQDGLGVLLEPPGRRAGDVLHQVVDQLLLFHLEQRPVTGRNAETHGASRAAARLIEHLAMVPPQKLLLRTRRDLAERIRVVNDYGPGNSGSGLGVALVRFHDLN